MNPSGPEKRVSERALGHLEGLREETMLLAWGESVSAEDRRRIVLAALIFGHQFEERTAWQDQTEIDEDELRRLLMSLMNGVVEEFARIEGLDRSEATAFLSEVDTRDHVLEFDEVLDAYAAAEAGRTLDELLREAVNGRRERARRREI